MPVKYLHYMIEQAINPECGENMFELSFWYYSTELPYVALRHHMGFYDTLDAAENAKCKHAMIEKFSEGS